VKPVALMRWLVRLVTPKGGTVLDPFMGSGSTALACDAEQFNFIGCELSADYAAIAERGFAMLLACSRTSRSSEETPHANDERGETKPPLKPPPSSSSSSSSVSKHSTSAGLAREPALPADLQAVMDESGITGPPDFRVLKGWYDLGADLQQDILPTIRKVMARDQGTRPGSLKYFTDAIREKLAADQAEIERLRGISRRYEQPEASGFRV
jgi:hypothetical protein